MEDASTPLALRADYPRNGVHLQVEDASMPLALRADYPRNGVHLQGVEGLGMAGPSDTVENP
jgi:hypothetical protein